MKQCFKKLQFSPFQKVNSHRGGLPAAQLKSISYMWRSLKPLSAVNSKLQYKVFKSMLLHSDFFLDKIVHNHQVLCFHVY
jgi:hypothetical protein